MMPCGISNNEQTGKSNIVPPPEFLSKKESNFQRTNVQFGRSPNKISTILTNVQRRNIQTTAVVMHKDMSVHQMAAQGELILLQEKVDEPGFQIDQQDSQGFSALLWACANGQKAAVEMLAYKGANLHLSGDNGENGLLLASCYGHHEIVLYLLRSGVSVNSSDELGTTSLMYAAFNNQTTCISILLDWGADITQEDAEGSTALSIAIRRNHKAAQRLLEKKICELLLESS